ncbi:MAG: NGG1p interacting factor NIF3 [Gammaproteobacteria bacterium RIFCSPHIGHO2_12_FULL_41_20]|nr:MAG: NGG1p interacting factor NIF3 [Gammaproteobacteria bacterium RIFCSPHIGHO2_12_FULL_41_20]
MFKICFYVPVTHTEQVKNAMFNAGAGKIGNYSHCAWQILGEGQFMPLTGSHAFIGSEGNLEKIAEYKVEMVCAEQSITSVIAALKKTHPYEEPAYQIIKLEAY